MIKVMIGVELTAEIRQNYLQSGGSNFPPRMSPHIGTLMVTGQKRHTRMVTATEKNHTRHRNMKLRERRVIFGVNITRIIDSQGGGVNQVIHHHSQATNV